MASGYRSRGYSFDITSSTAYDQYFVYGRPIYDSISRIVDEIFNEYVRRQGQNAPYFTSFCNESTVSCPGTLLRVGSTGLDVQTIQTYLDRIRQNYPAIPVITDTAGVFGDSTRAAVTRLAELNSEGTSLGIGTVPPGVLLRQGSKGQDVITLQYLLNVISEYYPGLLQPAQDPI